MTRLHKYLNAKCQHPTFRRSKFSRAIRYGLSIMEVMFAIGVLTVGMLGLASLLPIAAKNAKNALAHDSSSLAIENQVSNSLSRLPTGGLSYVDVPNHSRQAIVGGSPYNSDMGPYSGLSPTPVAGTVFYQSERFNQIFYRVDVSQLLVQAITGVDSSASLRAWSFSGYRGLNIASQSPTGSISTVDTEWYSDPVAIAVGVDFTTPIARPAFCIDPAFITAASNIRDDVGAVGNRNLNGYDRTLFPCYDLNYLPLTSPSAQLTFGNAFPMTPRMYRIALPSSSNRLPNHAANQFVLSEHSSVPQVEAKGELAGGPPSLFIRKANGSSGPLAVLKDGRYSSMVMLEPLSISGNDYRAHVVVFESRLLVINPPGTAASSFNLTPYVSTPWDTPAASPDSRTYGEEVMGLVVAAPGGIANGVGQFTYEHTVACNPEVHRDDWLLLMQWDASSSLNRYAWVQVKQITQEPTILGTVYQTTVRVRGPNWIFHPSQVSLSGASAGAISPFTFNPAADNHEKRQVTIVVKMPNVISVRTTNVSL